jgi:hypothetical protein
MEVATLEVREQRVDRSPAMTLNEKPRPVAELVLDAVQAVAPGS